MNLLPFVAWLLYSSITASVLALIIILVKRLGKNVLGTKGHYFIWFILIIKLFSPYSLESHASIFNVFNAADRQFHISDLINIKELMRNNDMQYAGTEVQQQNTAQSALNPKPVEKISTRPRNDFNILAHVSLNDVIFYIWFLGALVFALTVLYRDITFYFKVKQCRTIENNVLAGIIADCRKQMRVNAGVVPLLTNAIIFPSIYGIVKPKLLLPPQVLETLSKEELKYIVLHELSHVKRKDLFLNCLTITLKIMHWFNPIIQFALNSMKFDMEVSCDALALSFVNQNEYKEYGLTMINLLKNIGKNSVRVTNMAGTLSEKSQVRRRVIMISNFKENSYRWSAIALAIVLSIGVIGLTTPINANTTNTSAMQTSKGKVLEFADRQLSECIAHENNIPLNSSIYEGDTKKLKSLKLVNVENLQGIEYCSNLEELNLEYCSIKDLNPLLKLKNIKVLKIQLRNSNSTAANIDLTPLMELKNLEALSLDIKYIDNLKVISSLKNLKSLRLASPRITDVAPVSGLFKLERLDLLMCKIKDPSSLIRLKNLRTLHLDNCNITDISFIKEMKKIKELSITENNLTDISAVSSLPELESLNIDDNLISNIDMLSKMSKLKYLEISRNTLTDLKPLAELGNLEVLVASADHISDLSPLSNMKKLKHLELVHNNIRDVSPISDLPIETLVLSSNQVDITSLKTMESLTDLYLDNNDITDISPLRSLTRLTNFSLDDNRIIDLAPLSELTNLCGLNLVNNNITDIKPLAGMKNLNILHLKGNQIKDFSPITSFSKNIQYKDF